MANYTPNLNLRKPLTTEKYDVVADLNDTKDKIDNHAGAVNAQLAENKTKLETIKTAFDFGILPNNEIPYDYDTIATYFDYCQLNKVSAKFDSGVYTILGDNFQLPDYGIEGNGRNESELLCTHVNSANYMFKIGANEQWTKIKGDIKNIAMILPEDSTGNLLFVSTPSRAFQISNAKLKGGSGNLVSLEKTYYMNFSDVVFEGKYISVAPTDLTNIYKGTAIRPLDNTGVNNITFNKCDFRYLSRVWYSQTDLFSGSNNIKFIGCAFEYIGDTFFIMKGHKVDFDSCYIEKLDMNKAVLDRPNKSNAILLVGGGGTVHFKNTLINLAGVRNTTAEYLFDYQLGHIILDGGAITNRPSVLRLLRKLDYSSQGVIISRQSSGTRISEPTYKFDQPNVAKYPNFKGDEIYSSLMAEEKFAKSTLSYQSEPTATLYNFSAVQPIISVEGKTTYATDFVEVEATLYRFLTATNEVGFKKLRITFLISPSMPENITPTVTEIASGGNQAGFSDANLLTKFFVVRKTPTRTDMVNPYAWHYMLYIGGETGGATARRTNLRATCTIARVDKGTDEINPNYTIYPHDHSFGTLT